MPALLFGVKVGNVSRQELASLRGLRGQKILQLVLGLLSFGFDLAGWGSDPVGIVQFLNLEKMSQVMLTWGAV